ncbi:tRNA (cytidine(34)-2'-O)-methyltransferase [compost metagenome]
MKLNIVMVEPEIPQNTGNIARTCAAIGAKLHLVYPLGFDVSEKSVKRAGLDYWDKLDIEKHDSLEKFLQKYNPENQNMFFATTKGKNYHSNVDYSKMEEVF